MKVDAARLRGWLWVLLRLAAPVLLCGAATNQPKWPSPAPFAGSEEDELIRAQRVCLGSTGRFAGEPGDTLAYRFHREGDRLVVSYFAYWSSESPWGDEPLASALVIDAVYSHSLYVFPGFQYLAYGPGDIEGATITYSVEPSSDGAAHLLPQGGLADDKGHGRVLLSASDLRGAGGESCLLSGAWSHQLGAPGAAGRAEVLEGTCYEGDSLIPLTEKTARVFRLGSAAQPLRARPAWLGW